MRGTLRGIELWGQKVQDCLSCSSGQEPYADFMLTPKDCKRLDPSLGDVSDERLEAILKALYSYAEFFWDQSEKEGHGIPNVSLKEIDIEMKRKMCADK
jgi:hypothetical protein